ncbi:dTDP-4-dehydrorhamnose 3,5-epimerase family protein [Kitasatospora sp. NPDC096077]|uniref:dTDP-4-dehydrorhamnose 3,5-epimerase family protein n=1 Tax=Kitasatospora sp. NPDC096077 TaxID=3155544 RepID=UPI00331EB6C3
MDIRETGIPGAFVVTPEQLPDERGSFYEAMHSDRFARALGRPFEPRQIDYAVSRRNTLRGLHSVAGPQGRDTFVTCVRGALRAFLADLRLGSPAFGLVVGHELDADSGVSVFVPEGGAHGLLTLTDEACVCYVLSTAHGTGTQVDIDPLDPVLAIDWGFTEPPLMSTGDSGAMSLREAVASRVLTSW